MEKQATSTPPPPNTWKWGGSGYLYLHYWPPVDREPAINVDMVNGEVRTPCPLCLRSYQSFKQFEFTFYFYFLLGLVNSQNVC